MDNAIKDSVRYPVVVIGGGLAGIAAATALASGHIPVTLLESRPQLGGRATSYVDRESGETIDNCQHVSMGCCTNLRHLCESLGLNDAFQTESRLDFIGPDGTCTPFTADSLPAPFHLTRSFLRLPYLSWKEKWRFALGVRALAAARPEQLQGKSFAEWLREHHQTDALMQNVWEVVLVSALSESLDRIDALYARKVFVDGFLANSQGWKVEIPRFNLDELYSIRVSSSLRNHGVTVHTQSRVSRVVPTDHGAEVTLADGSILLACDVVLAVPQHQVASLVEGVDSLKGLVTQSQQLESAPITSVHLWYDRPLTDLQHAVLVGRCGQWLFNRGIRLLSGRETYYYQVVISASRQLRQLSQDEVIQILDGELQEIWPGAGARLIHSRMITEKRAVFSALPGVDQFRPVQQTNAPNIQVAGDWSQTAWPATMEGAVISGYLAAENIFRRHGQIQKFVQPGLPVSALSRLLLKL